MLGGLGDMIGDVVDTIGSIVGLSPAATEEDIPEDTPSPSSEAPITPPAPTAAGGGGGAAEAAAAG